MLDQAIIMVKLTLEVSGVRTKVMESDKSHKTIRDSNPAGSLGFFSRKERVTVPLTEDHYFWKRLRNI